MAPSIEKAFDLLQVGGRTPADLPARPVRHELRGSGRGAPPVEPPASRPAAGGDAAGRFLGRRAHRAQLRPTGFDRPAGSGSPRPAAGRRQSVGKRRTLAPLALPERCWRPMPTWACASRRPAPWDASSWRWKRRKPMERIAAAWRRPCFRRPRIATKRSACRRVEALGFSSRAEVPDLIRAAYGSAGDDARRSALVAMGRSGDRRWRDIVTSELRSPAPTTRREAARAAGELELRRSVPELAELLEDSNPDVALQAIWALGQIGGKSAERALLRAQRTASDEFDPRRPSGVA